MEREVVLWPPLKNTLRAHEGWTTYANVRLLITCDSLEKAKRYEENYVNTGCPTPDLSSEDEAGERGKRRVRPNPVYMESDGESETRLSSGGSHSEDVLSIHQADNGFCGSYLAELDQSMDHCNDGLPTYNSSPYHAMPLEKARNDGAPEKHHGGDYMEGNQAEC
ncbi:hypothetical protein KUCAC02_016421 [Chaenocephalus aceratus]|nr:hypothetical protein KUCAC02_016421 [Chaenocephalus aceratus]